MKVHQTIICEHCGKPIEPQDGFIIHGNVYVITEDSIYGDRPVVIGNNLRMIRVEPETTDEFIYLHDINEVAWHKQCLIRYLSKSLGETLR